MLEPDEQRFYEWWCSTQREGTYPMFWMSIYSEVTPDFIRIMNSLWREGLVKIEMLKLGHGREKNDTPTEIWEMMKRTEWQVEFKAITDPTEIIRKKQGTQ